MTFQKDFAEPSDFGAPFLKAGSTTFTRAQLINAAAALVQRERAFFDSVDQGVCPVPGEPVWQLVSVLAAALAKKPCVLGWNQQRPRPSGTSVLGADTIGNFQEDIATARAHWQVIQPQFASDHSASIFFYTSGSTGVEQIVAKNWFCLLSEVKVLNAIFGIRADDEFNSLVPTWHIYGFLYAFLLPFFSGASVRFNLHQESMTDGSVVVAIPSLWQRVVSDLKGEVFCPRLILSSGSPLPKKRVDEFRATRFNHVNSQIVDILGSTESGGIGYRFPEHSDEYECFPGVKLLVRGERTYLLSSFVFPIEREIELADRVEMRSANTFLHHGRQDGIFKYGSARYSLNEIEGNLTTILPERRLRCFFYEDDFAKGGTLLCLLEGASIDVLKIRSIYKSRFNTPFPDRIVAIASLEELTNEFGKIPFNTLKHLLE